MTLITEPGKYRQRDGGEATVEHVARFAYGILANGRRESWCIDGRVTYGHGDHPEDLISRIDTPERRSPAVAKFKEQLATLRTHAELGHEYTMLHLITALTELADALESK